MSTITKKPSPPISTKTEITYNKTGSFANPTKLSQKKPKPALQKAAIE
ncbi:hypothetical protein AGMMS49573_02220 [Endomicrobiia bacterium]|nr:hypothetical protein AGMMS49571_04170 [Endomicrobiia bacterium]GHT15537.1 hypothetical protein AGMMS49573_02220 [Endomicrobiia bacterium]GHT19953.1 hypothetical protein AGMMS49929_04990 [Endomicrobiia bacterium]GHT29693.1 hypothetical protein AGMMS5026_01640 [Endomicrobiia bacterium]